MRVEFSKIKTPTSIPTGVGYATAFSPDDNYLALGHSTTPFLTMYKRIEDDFTKIAFPVPSTVVNGITFSPNGNLLVLAINGTVSEVYNRTGDVFTKIATLTLPSQAFSVAFSSNGEYMCIGHNGGSFISIYKVLGDTFTKISDPNILPTGYVRSVSFSPDGQYLCVTHNNAPYATIYKKNGDSFIKVEISDPPSSMGYGCSFSLNGNYLSISTSATPFICNYKINGDSFKRLPNPSDIPTGFSSSVAYSPDSRYMVVGTNTTPYICIYEVINEIFTRVSAPADLPVNTVNSVSFSNRYLSVAEAQSPYIDIYKVNYIYENKILLSSGDKYYSVVNRKYENIIPVMTSNTSSAPIVPIFSTEWTNGIQAGAGSAFNAFDGDINKVSGWSSATNAFIGIDWGTAKLIEGYRITSHPTLSNTPPTGWIFEASLDNSTWITLDTKTGITWGKGEVKEFIISKTSYYRYYRLRCTVNSTFAVAELEMLKLSNPSLIELSETDENAIIKFSENYVDDFNFQMSKIKKVTMLNQPLGSGKIIEHTIDMSKRRVDKITLG